MKPYAVFLLIILIPMIASFMKISTMFAALMVPFNGRVTSCRPTQMETAAKQTLYDFKVNGLNGRPVDLSQFKGKKVVILNTASECGFTPQYADWEKFYERNKDKIVVIGFPSNDFGGQEPGSATEIGAFCQKNYGVTFPMMEKVVTKGEGQHPVYKWLSTKELNGWNHKTPTWNFCKYVVNEKGELTHFFASGIKPDNPEFLAAIK